MITKIVVSIVLVGLFILCALIDFFTFVFTVGFLLMLLIVWTLVDSPFMKH